MINKDSLVFTCSRQMPDNNDFIFNVHIEDYSDLGKYIHADFMLPSFTLVESSGFSPEEIDELKAYCKENYSLLFSMSMEETQKPLNSD